MLLRIIAWETLFYPTSILNSIGISLDLIGTDIAIIIGMVSIFLPFMIFPIYAVLDKLDVSLEEASADLGASPWQTFFRVTLPLSTSGIVSGIIMTFLPSATAFAIPQRLGGGSILLIGNIIENLFRRGDNYNLGSLLSLIVIIIIFIGMRILSKVDAEGETLI
jgi:spermidine/putrescine transport system permease protein